MKKRMKKMIALFMLVFMICTIQPITTMAKNETGHQISVKVYKVVLDSTKPLGYQTPELVTTTTVICQDRIGHSGYNHFVNLKDFYPTNFNLSTNNWSGWQFSLYYEKGNDRNTFYSWTKDQINATANVVGSQPYPSSKNFYMVYKEETKKYTVTYTDGVTGQVFNDQVNSNIPSGSNTPQFGNTPTRPGYVFTGWEPQVADKVTQDATYTAKWAEDKNNNGIDDSKEDRYTVKYVDGVNGEVFEDKVTGGLLEGDPTPQFGADPVRPGYIFTGWTPAVSDKVTGDVTYTATWAEDKNNNGIDDSKEDRYTVKYVDGVNGEVFEDKVTGGLLEGDPTPQFGADPVRPGYIFTGWTPAVSDKVTGDVTYTATWKEVETDSNESETVKPNPSEPDSSKPEIVEPDSTDNNLDESTNSADKDIVSPNTGNNNNVSLWTAMFLTTGMGVATLVYGKKRKSQAE